jgi:hypothetical protein
MSRNLVVFFLLFLSLFTVKRNVRGDDRLYVTLKNSGFDFIKGLYENEIAFSDEVNLSIDGMQGTVLLAEDCVVPEG